ncbi:MAG TPA: hypothetical protein VGE62_03595 [Candidatus Paceibacterota bacterium]
MLHLLTEEHKAKIIRQYRMRLLIVLCLGIVLTLVAAAIFLIPSYVISFSAYSEVQAEKNRLVSLVAAKQTDALANDVKEVSNTLEALKSHADRRNPTRIFERIVQGKPSGVSVTSFAYTPESDSQVTVDVAGKANTRGSLSSYVDMLKADKVFSGVSIPLSSFARERDISFNLKISVNTADESWIFSAPEASVVEEAAMPSMVPATSTDSQ